MKYYRIRADYEAANTRGKYWTLQENRFFSSLQKKHFMDGVPNALEIERLPVLLFADCDPLDTLIVSNFYDCFFVSERLKKALDKLQIPEEDIHFFEKNNLKWRGEELRYFWM